MTLLRLEHVSRHFGGNEVLRDVNLALEAGERVALIGPNGAGKSTLFNTISGQLPVTGGRVWLGDEDVTRLPPQQRVRRGIGRSFQLTSLLSGLSVQENVLLALQGRRSSRYHPLRARVRRPAGAVPRAAGRICGAGATITRRRWPTVSRRSWRSQ